MIKEFNLVISGVGGQGVLTLSQIIAYAAFKQGYDVKLSELHGLAQRGGHIETHIRFGKKIYSSIVMEGKANLIIGLEPLETLRACYYGSKENKTVFLFNTYSIVPLSIYFSKEKYPKIKRIIKILKNFGSKVISVDATQEVLKNFGTASPANVYLLSYAIGKKLLPLKPKFVLEGIKKVLPEKYFKLNKNTFRLACKK
jgi:indolepyruvate ferredoxin oxidoreductase beta subunit